MNLRPGRQRLRIMAFRPIQTGVSRSGRRRTLYEIEADRGVIAHDALVLLPNVRHEKIPPITPTGPAKYNPDGRRTRPSSNSAARMKHSAGSPFPQSFARPRNQANSNPDDRAHKPGDHYQYACAMQERMSNRPTAADADARPHVALLQLEADIEDFRHGVASAFDKTPPVWMAETDCCPTRAFGIHSADVIGVECMIGMIERYGPFEHQGRTTALFDRAIDRPFGSEVGRAHSHEYWLKPCRSGPPVLAARQPRQIGGL